MGGGASTPLPLYVRVKILFQHISIFLVFSCILDSDSLPQPFTSFSQPSDREIIWVTDNDDDKGWCDCTQAVFFFSALSRTQPFSLSVAWRHTYVRSCVYRRFTVFFTFRILKGDFKIQRPVGNENVALEVNLRSFSLFRDYLYPLTLSNVGEPSWSWTPRDHIQVQREK